MRRGSAGGVAKLRRVEAILANPAVYRLAELIPKPPKEAGGRRRFYPDYMAIVFEALISVYGSARQVEAELSHPLVWRFVRKRVKRQFPEDRSRWLPDKPMRRHHYTYLRNRYLADPSVLDEIAALHRTLAAGQARELGLLDDGGATSFTHPDPDRMLHADGKVITPLFRAKPGDRKVDRRTGEIKTLRAEPDASLHFEGDGEAAWGTKFVIVAARSHETHGRIILDCEWVDRQGKEAATAMACFSRLAPVAPGVQGIIYDTALRGVHHQKLLRELGWIPVNKVTAKAAGSKNARRDPGEQRVEKCVHVETRQVVVGDKTRTIQLFARGGALGIGELTDAGELEFTALARVRTHRRHDKSGRLFRFYNDYRLPEMFGGDVITVRLHGNEQDSLRRFNRTENVRVIAPSDRDFARLHRRRNDAESINRALEDSMWLGRAHSVGHLRQRVNLIGYALMVNSLALLEHRRSRAPAAIAA